MSGKTGIAGHLETNMEHGWRIKSVAAYDATECILKPAKIELACTGSCCIPYKRIHGCLVTRQRGKRQAVTAHTVHQYLGMSRITVYISYVYNKTVCAKEKCVLIDRVVVHIGANKKTVRVKTDSVVWLTGETPIVIYRKRIVTIWVCEPRIIYRRRVFPFCAGKENSCAHKQQKQYKCYVFQMATWEFD